MFVKIYISVSVADLTAANSLTRILLFFLFSKKMSKVIITHDLFSNIHKLLNNIN